MRKGGRRALKRGLVGLVESPSQLTALNLTTPISPHPSHHIPLTTPISPHPSHHTHLTTPISPHPSHHTHLTTPISPHPQEILERLEGKNGHEAIHAICVRSKTALTTEVLARSKRLLCAGCFCIGTDNHDLMESQKRGEF